MLQNLKVTQGYIRTLRQKGENDDIIADALTKDERVWDDKLSSRVREYRTQGVPSARILNDIMSLRDKPIVDEDDLDTEGFLGGAAKFLGMEKLGRRVGYELAQFDPQQRDTIDLLRSRGENESADLLESGGVSNMQALGGVANTALNLATAGTGGVALRGASKLGTAGRLAGFGAVSGAAGGLEESGTLGGAVKGAAVGSVLAPTLYGGLKGTQYVSRLLFKSLPKNVAASLAGKSVDAFDELIDRPQAALKGIRNPEKALNEAAETFQTRMQFLKNENNVSYANKFKEIVSKYGDTFTLKVNSPKVIATADDVLKKFDVRYIDDALNFDRATRITPSEQTNIEKAVKLIKGWDDFSIDGVNTLKSKVGDLVDFETVTGTKGSALLKSLRGKLNDLLTTEIKELKPINSVYSERKEFLKLATRILGSKKTGAVGQYEVYRKLGLLFEKNKDRAREVLNSFEAISGDDFLGLVAGREFSAQGASNFQQQGIIRSLFNSVVTPKIIGEAGIKTGQLKNWLSRIIPSLPATEQQALSEIVGGNVVRELSGELSDE